jgi:dsDNA-specific endonuclease/ATPase MutS2
MLDLFTGHSLCLIDEFGKGTAPIDGMALLAATVLHFRKTPPCRVLFTTHFLEIFHRDIIDTAHMHSVTAFKMDTYVDHNPRQDDDIATSSSTAVNLQAVTARKNAQAVTAVSGTVSGISVNVNLSEEVPLYKLKVSTKNYHIQCTTNC